MARFSKKCIYKGIKFDSETQRDFYKKLEHVKRNGGIKDFKHEKEYILQEKFKDWREKAQREIKHFPDFYVILNDDSEMLLDSKGGQSIEEVANIKRKLLMYQHPEIPYYFISFLPNYLGCVWVEVSKGMDFWGKIKNKYKEVHPESYKVKGRKPINWTTKDWEKYFEFENVAGLFYTWKKNKK